MGSHLRAAAARSSTTPCTSPRSAPEITIRGSGGAFLGRRGGQVPLRFPGPGCRWQFSPSVPSRRLLVHLGPVATHLDDALAGPVHLLDKSHSPAPVRTRSLPPSATGPIRRTHTRPDGGPPEQEADPDPSLSVSRARSLSPFCFSLSLSLSLPPSLSCARSWRLAGYPASTMVNTGKPSPGCFACRKRRIKVSGHAAFSLQTQSNSPHYCRRRRHRRRRRHLLHMTSVTAIATLHRTLISQPISSPLIYYHLLSSHAAAVLTTYQCDTTRPECRKCRKRGWKCPGYRDLNALRIVDETQKQFTRFSGDKDEEALAGSSNQATTIIRQYAPHENMPVSPTSTEVASSYPSPVSQASSPPTLRNPPNRYRYQYSDDVPRCIGPPVGEQVYTYFVSNFVQGGSLQSHGYFDFLFSLLANSSSDRNVNPLRLAFSATAMIAFAARQKVPELLPKAEAIYLRALEATFSAIGDPESARDDSTLACVTLLTTFEVITQLKTEPFFQLRT